MAFTPAIHAFCCHYTFQQSCGEGNDVLTEGGFPTTISIKRVSCTGKVRVTDLLTAFEQGADGVYVVGCPEDKCHNLMGSQRAAKRVRAVKKALDELGTEPERIEMFHLDRGLHPEFIAVAKEMDKRIRTMGACPLKGENK